MALANYTIATVGVATPAIAATSATPLKVDLDDLLYSPDDHQPDAPQQSNEPFTPPNTRRPKLRKRAGTAYLPPLNQFARYPQTNVPHNPYNLHTQVYQQNTRLDIQIDNQRVHEVNTQYDNTGQYHHDPTGDYDYEQRRLNQNPQTVGYSPGYAETPYSPLTTPSPSSRPFPNQNVPNFNFVNRGTAPTPPRTNPEPPKTSSGQGGSQTQTPPDRPRGFTKVETGASGGKTQLHAVLDYDDPDDYYDDVPGTNSGPAVTPLQGPILLRNGSVPVVPLTSYRTVNNGSFYQIPILWTALSLALGYELQGQLIRGVPCVKRNYQLYCPTAGNTYPLDKIETFIDENKALIKRMYGSFTTPGGNRVRRAPASPDMHDANGDSFFRHVRQASNTNLPDPQAINSTGRPPKGLRHGLWHANGDSYFRHVRQASNTNLPDPQAINSTGRVDACESKTEIMTPYWALNSARKLRAIVNTMHFEQAIHQEVCSKKTTNRCTRDCGCEQKYKWHRLLAYDPSDDCAGIFMDWFLFPSCCVCRCNP